MEIAPQISRAILLRIMRSVRIASFVDGVHGAPHEKCGILRGRGTAITEALMTDNASTTPADAFEIDAAALIGAYRRERRARGLSVLGFFHTHPTGDAVPSIRDAQGAAPDGKLWLIASMERAIMWRAVKNGQVHGRFDHVVFDMSVGKRIEARVPAIAWRQLQSEWSFTLEH